MVGLTFVLAPVAHLGTLYVVTAAVLGVGFIALAIRLWVQATPKASMQLFSYSITYLTLLFVIVLYVLAQNTVRSRLGRAFIAVRDSEIAAQSLGVDLLRYKALAFGISGFYAGVAGGLYSALLNFVSPEGYDLFQMVLQKSMIVVGGLGSIVGSVLGAGAIVSILELLRTVKGAQEIAFGAILVGFILFMPGGIAGRLKQKVRGWEEPLHRSRRAESPATPAHSPAPSPAPSPEGSEVRP